MAIENDLTLLGEHAGNHHVAVCVELRLASLAFSRSPDQDIIDLFQAPKLRQPKCMRRRAAYARIRGATEAVAAEQLAQTGMRLATVLNEDLR